MYPSIHGMCACLIEETKGFVTNPPEGFNNAGYNQFFTSSGVPALLVILTPATGVTWLCAGKDSAGYYNNDTVGSRNGSPMTVAPP